jgi:MoaA/NifB/PqqE/SkfB family radical SAM enzyme
LKLLSSFNKTYLKAVLNTLRIVPSLRVGSNFYHSIFPRRGNAVCYITNKCNSKCPTCMHWIQKEKYELPPQKIEELLKSKTIGNSNWIIEGGEVFCHSQIDEIFKLMKDFKANYTLLTNGLFQDRLVKAIEKYKIKAVNISLDGDKEVYKRTRGFDGYDTVVKTIDLIKNKTTLGICYTASPWNTYEDYLHVKKFCNQRGLRLLPNIFCDYEVSGIPHRDKPIDERYSVGGHPFMGLYNDWIEGKVYVPCLAVLFTIIIMSNGNVFLCLCNQKILGNLHEKGIDEIWNSPEVKALHNKTKSCNDCWLSCHRHFDVKWAMMRGKDVYNLPDIKTIR